MAKITGDAVQKLFADKLIYSSEYLRKYFGCTYQCIWDNLKKMGYYSSFTHNSKYYTLAAVPEFDANDVWFHTDPEVGAVGFTKKKTASQLILSLINSSPTGVTQDSLTKIMRIRVANQLHILVKQSKIRKVKIKNKCYYFSINPKRYQEQYAKLTETVSLDTPAATFCNEQFYRARIKKLTRGRENWRQRANEKQKRIREHILRLRDLERSRDKWKSLALQYKNTILQLKATLDNQKKSP